MNSEIIAILTVLLTLFAKYSKSSTACASGRVVGGNDVPSETWYPSVVHLGGCGSTILNKVWLLTAAHCQVSNVSTAIAGNPFKCPESKYEQKRGIEKVFRHEQYEIRRHFNDIALVQLNRPLEFTPAVQPVTLIRKNYQVPDNTLATVVGWGSTEAFRSEDPPQRLQHVDVPILSNEACIKVIQDQGDVYHPGMICAGLMKEGGKDACQGDSGGPLYATESGKPPSQTPWNEHFQVGIVAFGRGCARPGFPTIYEKVQYYLDWIEITMRENRHESEVSAAASTSFDVGDVQKVFVVFGAILEIASFV